MKTTIRYSVVSVACLLAASLLSPALPAIAAEGPASQSADKQRELLRVLQSDAPAAEKAITCKKLAIYGSDEAVPALAALLPNEQLSSWARIALEAIPGPVADAALRDALGKVQGRQLVGVINSIGVRHDLKAVEELTGRLKDGDVAVASASAAALGKIGGSDAAKALEQALAAARPEVLPAVASGCVVCAEGFLTAGKNSDAMRVYDLVRAAKLPRQRILEATRGAILARGLAGIPLLLEQLRSPDKAMYGIGLRVARELAGREVTAALLQELDRAAAVRQAPLLLAVVDRRDATVLPTVLKLAQSGAGDTRRTALGLLERFGDLTCVPVLLQAAAEGDAEMTRIAQSGLSRLEGAQVDADLLARLQNSTGRTRQVLLEMVKLRRISAAMPAVVLSVEDGDPEVRRAAVETLGVLGGELQAADLVRVLPKVQGAKERADIERALIAICARVGKACLPRVAPLAKSGENALRQVALRAYASMGGTEALAAVQGSMSDSDEAVQDEAVGILGTWPGNWPDDVAAAGTLLELAKSGRKLAHRVQGVRGYLQFVEEHKSLSADDKVAKIRELLPVVQRPEEKRLVIATLSTVPTGGALEILMPMVQESGVAEEASLAVVKIATTKNLSEATREVSRKALQMVVDKSQSEATRRKAEEALKKLP